MDLIEFKRLFDKENYKRHPWEISRKRKFLYYYLIHKLNLLSEIYSSSISISNKAVKMATISSAFFFLVAISISQFISIF